MVRSFIEYDGAELRVRGRRSAHTGRNRLHVRRRARDCRERDASAIPRLPPPPPSSPCARTTRRTAPRLEPPGGSKVEPHFYPWSTTSARCSPAADKSPQCKFTRCSLGSRVLR
ncbi:hypothetical protein O0L34_g2090 [Tuta absoluta]|nr:hypothetical protein O0L34_g2090 [Tuta absoluta]